MKTVTDLRIKYKLETGINPMWENYSYTDSSKFKSTYGLWLEEQLGNSNELRENYYNCEKNIPVFKRRTCINDVLTQNYIFWLEEKLNDTKNN